MWSKAWITCVLCSKTERLLKADSSWQRSAYPLKTIYHSRKKSTAIDADKVDWKMLGSLGLSRERLEQSGELEKMLNWQKSNLVTIAIPIGDTAIYTKLALPSAQIMKAILG